MAISCGAWVKGILREDALATQRRYRLSHLAEEENEALRNENRITVPFGAPEQVCVHACLCVRVSARVCA